MRPNVGLELSPEFAKNGVYIDGKLLRVLDFDIEVTAEGRTVATIKLHPDEMIVPEIHRIGEPTLRSTLTRGRIGELDRLRFAIELLKKRWAGEGLRNRWAACRPEAGDIPMGSPA